MSQCKLSIQQDRVHSVFTRWWTRAPNGHSQRPAMIKSLLVLLCFNAAALVQAADLTLTTFVKRHLTPLLINKSDTIGDFNNDKRPDILIGNKKGTFVLFTKPSQSLK
jgi:hypothetical protein